MFRQGFTCPVLLFVTPLNHLSCTGLSPPMVELSRSFHQGHQIDGNWAVPLSLAATKGISVDFFSSGYLDVSVHRVRFLYLCIQYKILCKQSGFPHSEILGSKLVCQLTEAYRKLLRPSSPLTAQASTMCAQSLDHITQKTFRHTVCLKCLLLYRQVFHTILIQSCKLNICHATCANATLD